MRLKLSIFCIIVLTSFNLHANDASLWLKDEIDNILSAYENNDISKENRFLLIEKTINDNFAGAGIGKFVVGKAWDNASKDTKKNYIKNFKRHLALNIASMMQGYTNQRYELTQSKLDKKNNLSLIDMEIYSDTGSVVVTWRVKEAKEKYYIIDLLVADISLVVTKRSEFNSMLKNVDYNLLDFNQILHDQNEESYYKLIN